MPQLDPTTFAPQLVWLAITFVLLYLLMAKLALPRVGGAIDRRRAKIDGDLGAARQMQTQAETVLAAYERSLAEARAEAQAVLRETADRLSAAAVKRQEAASARLAAETSAAEARIAAAQAAALANVRVVAVEVARSATVKLLGRASDDEAASAAVDAVMRERG